MRASSKWMSPIKQARSRHPREDINKARAGESPQASWTSIFLGVPPLRAEGPIVSSPKNNAVETKARELSHRLVRNAGPMRRRFFAYLRSPPPATRLLGVHMLGLGARKPDESSNLSSPSRRFSPQASRFLLLAGHSTGRPIPDSTANMFRWTPSHPVG